MEETKEKTTSFKEHATHLKDHVKDYVHAYTELAKAKATRGVSSAVSGVVVGVSALLFTFFFLFFVAFGLGWWFGDLVHSHTAGFFMVAGLFLLLTLLLFALRKKVIVPIIRNAIIRKVYE